MPDRQAKRVSFHDGLVCLLAPVLFLAIGVDTRTRAEVRAIVEAPAEAGLPSEAARPGRDVDVLKVPRCTHDLRPCDLFRSRFGRCCLNVASSNVTGIPSLTARDGIPDAEGKECGVQAKFYFLPCARYTGKDCGGVLVHPAGIDTCQ